MTSQKNEMERPEWREESKSLHSSATPIPTVADDAQPNNVEGTKPLSTNNNNSLHIKTNVHEKRPVVPDSDVVSKLSVYSCKNDGKLERSTSNKSRNNSYQHNISQNKNNVSLQGLKGFDSFNWKQDITGFGNDVLQQCHIPMHNNPVITYAPPVPPKMRSPQKNTPNSKQDPHVRDSLISTTSVISQAVLTGETNLEKGERKIGEGFYCQPRKLPTLTSSSLSPLLRHARSYEIDPEVKEMLIQSYDQSECILESTSLDDSCDGELGVLVDSDDDDLDPENNPLLDPIEMTFDDESVIM